MKRGRGDNSLPAAHARTPRTTVSHLPAHARGFERLADRLPEEARQRLVVVERRRRAHGPARRSREEVQQIRIRHGERAREALVGEDEGIPERIVPGHVVSREEGGALANRPRSVPTVEAAAIDDANIANGDAAKVRPVDHERRITAACRGGCERGAKRQLEGRRADKGLLGEAGRHAKVREDRRAIRRVHGRLIERVEAVAKRHRCAVVKAADAAQSAGVVVCAGKQCECAGARTTRSSGARKVVRATCSWRACTRSAQSYRRRGSAA